MDTNETTARTTKKTKPKSGTDSLRVRRETKKRILAELGILNKKDFGKPVTPDQYVNLAISLLRPEHLQSLREQSLSNKDRMEKRYVDYCSEQGKVSRDEFIGILLGHGGVA